MSIRQMERKKYSAVTNIYVASIILLGLLSAVLLFRFPSSRAWDPWPFLFFGALTFIATSLSITFQSYLPSRGVIQISSSFVYALLFLTHPGAVAAVLTLLPIFDYFFNRRKILTVLFNIGQLLFSLTVAIFLWEKIGTDAGLMITTPRILFSALLVLVAFSLLNHLLTNIVISFATRKPFFQTGFLNRAALYNECVVITLGLSMAVLWTLYPPMAILSVIPIAILFTMLVMLSKKEANLVARQVELTTLNELALEVSAELEMKKLSRAIVRIVTDSLHASASLLAFYENDPRVMNIHASHNIPKEEEIPGSVSAPQQNFLSDDRVYISNRFSEPLFEELPLERFNSFIVLPISVLNGERGILAVFAGPERKNFDAADAEELRNFGKFINMALTNAALYDNLRTAQSRLIEVEKLSAVGMLVSGIAHELNNPLTSIIGYTDLLYGKMPEENEKRKLEKIASEAQRAARIVRNLSTFARESKTEKRTIDLNEFIRQTLKIKSHDFGSCNIRVIDRLSPGLDPVLANPNQMEQVFLNILNNAEHALKSIHGEKTITIETSSSDGWIEAKIGDNGPGISQENIKKIFLPFFTTKEVGRGTGLGLSICYGIVDEHGGKILAESTMGRGTTFIIRLPAVKEPAMAAGQDSRPASPASELARKKILIVDDEQAIREVAAEFLSIHGAQVETASNGSDALDKIARQEYDLVIADIKMPVLNGINLFHSVQERNPLMASRFIFFTGDSGNEETGKFIRQSGQPFLLKPFSAQDLCSTVSKFFKSLSVSNGG